MKKILLAILNVIFKPYTLINTNKLSEKICDFFKKHEYIVYIMGFLFSLIFVFFVYFYKAIFNQ
jgi:hypothetical protein